MRVGIIGTGAIAHKHAEAYRNIGYELAVCANRGEEAGRSFAVQYGCEFAPSWEELCRDPRLDFVDVCTLPNFRLQPVRICARAGRHIQVQKPMATNLATAREMVETTRRAGILLNVVSQHRFDDSVQFLKRAMAAGRLGKLLQADAYVKWYRSAAYYARPGKGSWRTEGGGALINQAIHQVDILLFLAGRVSEVSGMWQTGAAHAMESEDVVSAVLRYGSGATGVIQASTAFWPGYCERVEIHGTQGAAIITGDKLTTWDVRDDEGEPAPLSRDVSSGAFDPMAISLAPFERQFRDFGEAIRARGRPCSSGEDGYRALELVMSVYGSCREGRRITIGEGQPQND
jgi:UDP-N-acetyl-2-amino-2-deoxyglucuronate dehydrogenase